MPGGLTFCLSCAARRGSAHPTSPLSFCQRCRVSQCARRCCAPHRCRGVTSPVLRKCWSVRWSADMASARWRIVLDQPSPAARPGRRVHGSCGARPLRPPATLLHNAAFWKVLASRSAKAPLGVAHRFAPLRVSKTGVMQSGLRWSRSHSRRRFPVATRPTRRQLYALVGMGIVAYVRRFAHCFGQWPSASLWCLPPPTHAACLLRKHRPRGLPVRPPRGLPQNRASYVF